MPAKLKELLNKYLSKNINIEELHTLNEYLHNIENSELQKILTDLQSLDEEILLDNNVIDEKVHKIFTQIKSEIEIVKPKSILKLYSKYLIAACALIVCFLGFLSIKNNFSQNSLSSSKAEIGPASNFANLILENGDTVKLTENSPEILYSRDGISIVKNNSNQLNYIDSSDNNSPIRYVTVQTPKGGYTNLTLGDGTKVNLNSGATLRYPFSFQKEERLIEIEGEAYLDVAHNERKPFRIKTGNQIIEVLGTELNIKANNEWIKTTLIEGKIKLKIADQEHFLKPSMQSTIYKNGKVLINNVNISEILAWKNNQFFFDNLTIVQSLKEIENWYDVQFILPEGMTLDGELYGLVSRDVKLKDLLKVIEINTKYKFEIRERSVYIKK